MNTIEKTLRKAVQKHFFRINAFFKERKKEIRHVTLSDSGRHFRLYYVRVSKVGAVAEFLTIAT